jgi:hypothetical protein
MSLVAKLYYARSKAYNEKGDKKSADKDTREIQKNLLYAKNEVFFNDF